jgi:glycosyltransferase involved in cell wall biosynthesis
MTKQDGWALEIVRVPWPQLGWRAALQWLVRESESWRGRWVLVQYTALAWSRRGFPLGLLYVLWILRRHGARCVMIFHDTPYPGNRWIDHVRRTFQTRIMRAAYNWSDYSVLTFDLDKVAWLPPSHPKAVFIPVGANVFSPDQLGSTSPAASESSPQPLSTAATAPPSRPLPQDSDDSTIRSLAVFGLSTWPSEQKKEVEAIVYASREAAARLGKLQLLVMGRGSQEAAASLQEGLVDSKVVLKICGVLSGREIGEQLMACDASLFIRRGFSTRRGTGLAAIAYGVPMVAYRGDETGFPLTEGGIAFVSEDDLAALADELTRVLSDGQLRASMRARNEALFRAWFSWDRIAERLIRVLSGSNRGAGKSDSAG